MNERFVESENWKYVEFFVGTTLPVLGVSFSLCLTFFQLFQSHVWSWGMFVYVMMPFVLLGAVHLLAVGVAKQKYRVEIGRSRKANILLLFAILMLCVLNLLLWLK